MEIICFKDDPTFCCCFLKYFGDKYGVRGSRFGRFFGSSRNHPKSIAIDPGVRISYFGVIETQTKQIDTLKNKEKQNIS